MSLSTVYHTGPVTALHCHGNSVLAGIGSQVHVYSIPHTKLHQSIEVLPARVIHGIKQVFDDRHDGNSATLCVYGQKCLCLVDFDSVAMTIKPLCDVQEFSDWIWDLEWIKDSSASRQLCLALGHNVIITYDIDQQCITSSVHCQEKCILYCAKFLTSQPDCVILAAGTVFNQVVIWSAQSTLSSSGRVEPFHRLTGHQGVIFSVDYDPESQLICSVSDDRSIRLYRIMFNEATSQPSLRDWEKMDTTLLHVLYGHSARVWDVRLLASSFVSVGEDSTCCIWSYEGQVLKKFKGHKGKSIWSLCVDKGEKYVITGGGDNSVRLWNLQQQEMENEEPRTRSLDLQLDPDDFPRNTMLLDIDRVLTITNMGNLVLYNQATDRCTNLMSDVLFGSYTVMSVSPNSRYIAVGNIHGTLRILHATESSQFETRDAVLSDVKVFEGKLFSVVWLGEDILLTTAPQGIVNIWEISHHDNKIVAEMTFTFVLTPSKHRWVSTATLAQEGSRIVVGDRTGSLFLYKLVDESKTGELIQTFPKIHGKAGATFVCCHDNHVYSAGRDGIYRMFIWNEDGQLDLLHNNRVCKSFEWLEKLEFTDEDDIHVHGFYTNMFMIWSVRQNQKLLEVECGGGHRAWDYCCRGNSATFVYVKTREVKVTNVEMRSNQVIVKKCLHGRELCDAKYICSGCDSSGRPVNAMVTCSEDTSVCLSVLYYKNGIPQLDVCHSLTGHISTVRCLFVCSSSHPALQARDEEMENPNIHRKLIFSGGGRAQLKVWSIEVRFPDTENGQQRTKCDTSHQNSAITSAFQDTESGQQRTKCDTSNQNLAITSGAESIVSGINEQLSNNHSERELSEQGHILSDKHSFKCNETSDNSKSEQQVACDNKEISKCGDKCTIDYVCLAGLQLSEINRKCRKPWRQPVDNSDPETRILDLSVVTPEELGHTRSRSLYFVSVACSDGFLRLLAFDEVSREITMVASSSYHDHCILKTCHVIVPKSHVTKSCDIDHVTGSNQWSMRIVILSAATDGKVAFWDVTEICKDFLSSNSPTSASSSANPKENSKSGKKLWNMDPVFALELHQSGINGLYFGKYSDDTYILVTGGDDNAVHVNIVTMATDETSVRVKVIAKGKKTSAHSAQITGAWFVCPDYVVTASIDQRICVWKLTLENTEIQLTMSGCVFTSVSDVANIDMWKERDHYRLLVSGNGMEVLKLETSEQLEDPVLTEVLTKIVS